MAAAAAEDASAARFEAEEDPEKIAYHYIVTAAEEVFESEWDGCWDPIPPGALYQEEILGVVKLEMDSAAHLHPHLHLLQSPLL